MNHSLRVLLINRVRRTLTETQIRYIAGAIYSALVWIECGVVEWLDVVFGRKKKETGGLENLTALINTFERPAVLRRLLRSLKRYYPDLRVIVVDDSKDPKPIEGVEWIQLPFDSGVSLGRNTGLSRIKTPYVLIMDDDFVLTRSSGIREALREIEKYPKIDIMGGKVIDLPFFISHDYSHEGVFPTDNKPLRLPGTLIGPYPVYEKVPNFYIARTDRLKLVVWDTEIKRLDHAEFFTRAKGVLITVFNKKLRCLHAKTPFNRHYMRYREDLKADGKLIARRYFQKKFPD